MICRSCGGDFPVEQMHDNRGYYTRCKKCWNDYTRRNRMAKKLAPEERKHAYQGRPRKRKECGCLTCDCDTAYVTSYDGKPVLVCGEEACFMQCETCTEQPTECKNFYRKREEVG